MSSDHRQSCSPRRLGEKAFVAIAVASSLLVLPSCVAMPVGTLVTNSDEMAAIASQAFDALETNDGVRTASAEAEQEVAPDRDTGSAEPESPDGLPQDAIVTTPHDPRTPAVASMDYDEAVKFHEVGRAVLHADLHPEEYLFDGGDRKLPVRYDQHFRLGLDTEDTVAEYVDDTGDFHVRPSNRVSIYAPRFGVVQSVSSAGAGLTVERATGAHDSVGGHGMRTLVPTGIHSQREGLGGVRLRHRASGMDGEMLTAAANQSARPTAHELLQNVHQSLRFSQSGELLRAEQPRLAYGIQAALAWTRDQYPVVAASTAAAQQVEVSFKADSLVGIEDKKTKGRLRIVKLADKRVAEQGEIVRFTIRYDNLGDRELSDLRVVDNLTSRLQYVDDSATSDRAGRLVVHDNGEGSLVLEFLFDNPLEGKDGGLITFEARVR